MSLFALQSATLLGAKAIVISSSDDKLERVAALRADEGIILGLIDANSITR